MTYNFHTHTFRCNHADGMEEEYINRAIENGIKHMGFSDHIPLKFDDGTQSVHRIDISRGKEYCDNIKELREKYKDKIHLIVGFEMEYYPEYFDRMYQSALEYGAEYLILGEHFLCAENIEFTASVYETKEEKDLEKYVDLVLSAMETGVFTYVAHPDILNYVGDDEIYKKHMRKICIASKRLNIPLELNFLGIRKKRHYPNNLFWQIAGEEKSPVTFGFDAHTALDSYDGKSLEYANDMVKRYKLNYTGMPKLVLIKKGDEIE